MNIMINNQVIPPHLIKKWLGNGRYTINEDGEYEKRCARCRQYWPADTQFYGTHSQNSDRLRGHCKCCDIERKALAKQGIKQVASANQLTSLPVIRSIPTFTKTGANNHAS